MDNFRSMLLKILILAVIITVLLASVTEAKKTKKQRPIFKKHNMEHIGNHHRKAKRSAYGRSWIKSSYGNYGLPPYLVYNKQIGAYYPYSKYPENSVRRSMRKAYSKQYRGTPKTSYQTYS